MILPDQRRSLTVPRNNFHRRQSDPDAMRTERVLRTDHPGMLDARHGLITAGAENGGPAQDVMVCTAVLIR